MDKCILYGRMKNNNNRKQYMGKHKKTMVTQFVKNSQRIKIRFCELQFMKFNQQQQYSFD